MNLKSVYSVLVASLMSVAIIPQANSATIVADTVIDFFNAGTGVMTGSYGGTYPVPSVFPVAVPLSYATDGNSSTFVSLPKGSYITLGFSSGYIFDGAGLDLFISEVGGNNETANVFVSSNFGSTFTFLGIATTATVSGFDLASIGYKENVNAVKIVGLDSFGSSPGFDIAFVQGIEGSVVANPVPVPVSAWLLGSGLLGLIGVARRKVA